MIEDIVRDLQAYSVLRQRHCDSIFAAQLGLLMQWQQERFLNTHHSLPESEGQEDLLEFIAVDVYGGIELGDLSDRLVAISKLLNTLFSDLKLIKLAVAFNRLTIMLNHELTDILYSDLGIEAIDDQSYALAVCQQDRLEERIQQLTLMQQFTDEISAWLHTSSALRSAKLAKYPAKAVGLGELQRLIVRGLETTKRADEAEKLILQLVRGEQLFFGKVYCMPSIGPIVRQGITW